MRYNTLARTDLKVSELCLGSMTWGTQNSQDEAHAQIDMALERGINFVDVAELYPSNPLSKETQGDTERIMGEWFAKTGRRNDVILATKISGGGNKHIRNGEPASAANFAGALDASLERLKTDYIDIYQIHWPSRGSYAFRQNWTFNPTKQNTADALNQIMELLQAAQKQIDAGKMGHIALSNESAWGTAQWVRLAEQHGLPRVVSIQNEYSLINRHFDLDLAELSHHEDVGLLSYSPLAAGLLTGKYQPNVTPAGSRRSISENLGGRISPQVWKPVQAYVDLAAEHGLDPAQMALAWCSTRPFMASVIFGATSAAHVDTALGAADITLSEEVMAGIQAIYRQNPTPM